ncbi:hypothetical protein THRCLA_07285 [Thraustotheca clavata]|uniref:Uncharacterized protein n=1 Tax=Thraustotheca clavata TaxID=74557 RepID=A0A1V9ZEK8_9STRA|nr:hypothetical protein THRCLA_07285 [Thraustotheca clavata]
MAITFPKVFKKDNGLSENHMKKAKWLRLKTSSKCFPYSEEIPLCCKARIQKEKVPMPQYQGCSPEVTISHRFIDRTKVRVNKLATIVGGHKVPFLENEIWMWKSEFEHMNTLTSIAEEDKSMCESCHALAFTKTSRNVCIALTKVSRRRTA